MKNLALKTTYLVLALLITLSSSCSVEDGAQGPPGAQGIAGTNGADGTDGTNGNANVQTLKFDATGFVGYNDKIIIAEITQDVIDNDAILSYLTDDGINWAVIPCPYDTFLFDFSVHVSINVGHMELDYGNAAGTNFFITAGDLQELKVIIIESEGTITGKSSTSTKQVHDELNNAGIDIKDYYAVCDYYGIEY